MQQQTQLTNSIEFTNDYNNISKTIMHSLSNNNMNQADQQTLLIHNKRSRLNEDDSDSESNDTGDNESYADENDQEVENTVNQQKLNGENQQLVVQQQQQQQSQNKSYTPISPVSSSSSYQSDSSNTNLTSNPTSNESNFNSSSSNDLMKMMLMIRQQQQQQQQHHNNVPSGEDNQLLPSPLVRTCSNSSSTSTGSSCSSISTNSSHKLTDSSQYQSQSQPSSATSSLCTSTSNLSLMNDNNLKALMMSMGAAAAAAANGKPAEQQSQNSAALAAVAAFADQFAYMVRSRSSSLSDSSTSSSSSSTTNSNYSLSNQSSSTNQNINNLINMCAGKVNEQLTTNGDSTTNTNSSSSSNGEQLTDLLQNSVAASFMKQMISTYQSAVTNPDTTKLAEPKPTSSSSDSITYSSSSMSSPISNRKSSSSSTTSNASSSSQANSYSAGGFKQISNMTNLTTSQSYGSSNSMLIESAAAAAAAAKNDEIKAKINAVANKSIMLNGAAPTSTPCKVCGDEASGFHYGVDSCEGCKGFFRRCITQGMNHQCTNNQQCEMTPFSRNSCQFCRLKKCFAVGMSREASRLGRRPKRAKDDKESSSGSFSTDSPNLLNLSTTTTTNTNTGGSNFGTPNTTPLKQTNYNPQIQTKTKPDEATNNTFDSKSSLLKLSTPITLNTDCMPMDDSKASPNSKNKPKKDLAKIPSKNDLLLNIPSNPPFKLDPSTQQSPVEKLIASNLENSSTTSSSNEKTSEFLNKKLNYKNLQQQNNTISLAQQQKETSQQQMQQIEMLTKLISISDRHTSIERTNEIEYIRTTIIESHCRIWPTTFEKIRRRYLERPPVKAPKPVDSSGVKNEILWNNLMNSMVPLILDVVKFCRYIPGLSQLPQSDQIRLLQQGSLEVICVNSFMLVDAQNKLMLTPDMEYLMDSTSIKSMPFGLFMNDVFELGIQASPLRLTDSEIALFNSVLVLNPDRGDLHDKDHVEELQATMLHVLYKHLKYYRSDEPDLFFKLLKLIPVIQEINRRHSELLNTLNTSQSLNTSNVSSLNNLTTISSNNISKTIQPSNIITSSSSSSASTSPVKIDLNNKKVNYMEQM